jgi:hypothetical protein
MSTRRVRRLRVRAEDEDDARRAATLLADALRTASLPLADQGRLVVIRHLPLGRISVRVSASSLALQIERVVREIVSQAVAYDLPAAAAANAVAFPDRSDAIVALARLHATAAPTDQWFWSDVVHGWRADRSCEERWQLILDAAHALPEAAVVSAAVIDQAVRAGTEDALLSAIRPGQGAQWLRMEGWSSGDAEAAPSPRRHALPLRHASVIERWRRRWGSTDDRLIWVSTLLTVGENRAVVADARLPSRIAATLRAASERPPSSSAAAGSRLDPERDAIAPAVAALTTGELSTAVEQQCPPHARLQLAAERDDERPAEESSNADPVVRAFASSHAPSVVDAPATQPAAMAIARLEESRIDVEPLRVERRTLSGQYTPHAGLLFLVPILDRLGVAAFLDAHPELVEIDFPVRLIRFIGERVGLRPEDPLAVEFRREPAELPDLPLLSWTTAVRRWCRRHACQGLHSLIRRPGRVYISRTHLDACFDLSQLDLRLRRVALDVDPGWVPWMGRVVQFSYLEHDEHSH